MRRPRTHCKNCNMELDALNSQYANGRLAAFCQECYKARKRESYERTKSPEKILRWNMMSKYGITPEEYNQMYEDQQFGCAVCRMPFDKLDVDHNHETGEVRGLLCAKCNLIVSYVENFEDLVINATEYLKRTTWLRKAG